jgi:hypothetical protein
MHEAMNKWGLSDEIAAIAAFAGIIGSGNMGASMGKTWAAKGTRSCSASPRIGKSCGQLPPPPAPMHAPARPPGPWLSAN